MATTIDTLIVEDSLDDLELVLAELQRAGFAPQWRRVETEVDFLAEIRKKPEIILSDFSMPRFNGMRAAELLQQSGLDIPFILISGTMGEDVAVEAMKLGTTDYLLKDRIGRLGSAVHRALDEKRLRDEHRQAEAEKRLSDERFQQLSRIQATVLNALPANIALLDSSGVIVTVNDSWRRFGLQNALQHPDACIGENYLEYCESARGMNSDEARAAAAGIRGVLNGDSGEFAIEYPCHSPAEQRWFRLIATPLPTNQEQAGAVVMHINISERKAAEMEIRRRDEVFRLLIEQGSDLITVVNVNGLVRFQSPSAERVLGYSPEELVDHNVLEFAHPDDVPRIISALKRAMSDPTLAVSVEHRSRHRDGHWLTLQSIGRSVPNEDPDGFIIVNSRDVTERKIAEEVLREQAKLLDLAQDAIMVRGLDGQIHFWNRGASQIYGWSAEEAMQQTAVALLRTDAEKYGLAKTETLAKGEWRGEFRQFRKDGSEVIVHGHWTLMRNDKGEPKDILVINRDVTEQKKLEAQFLRSQRVESLGTLASGVAHDLNNILAPIMMSLQLLRNSPSPASLERLANIIETSAQRGANIVKQILTFGRGVSGDRLPLQLTKLIQELEKITLETFPKNILIETSFAPDLPLIQGDATQIHQVLLNLFINARDAMPQGGTLYISAEGIAVDESFAGMSPDAKVGHYVQVTVTDTGTGIPNDILEKIFDPFFTTKEAGKGTGLGLSTVIGIVKSHGGFLRVQSEVGKGTSFTVFLPVVGGQESNPVAGAAMSPQGHGEKILVVDDEGALRIVAEAMLIKNGYEVLLASDGVEAIALYAQHVGEIALVLTDVMMPLMDGVALSRALHHINPQVRIIASTGQGGEPRRNELRNIGVTAFLPKPYSSPTLLRAIHDTITAA